MLKKKNHMMTNKDGLWRLVHFAQGLVVTSLVIVLVLELATPVRVHSGAAGFEVRAANIVNLSEILSSKSENPKELGNVVRRGLFKASVPLNDKPVADKTIERIKSQLKLQCIMEMNGQRIAYINIKNTGLKKCKAGDSVNDIFTVLSVNETSVEISIVEHKVTLSI